MNMAAVRHDSQALASGVAFAHHSLAGSGLSRTRLLKEAAANIDKCLSSSSSSGPSTTRNDRQVPDRLDTAVHVVAADAGEEPVTLSPGGTVSACRDAAWTAARGGSRSLTRRMPISSGGDFVVGQNTPNSRVLAPANLNSVDSLLLVARHRAPSPLPASFILNRT